MLALYRIPVALLNCSRSDSDLSSCCLYTCILLVYLPKNRGVVLLLCFFFRRDTNGHNSKTQSLWHLRVRFWSVFGPLFCVCFIRPLLFWLLSFLCWSLCASPSLSLSFSPSFLPVGKRFRVRDVGHSVGDSGSVPSEPRGRICSSAGGQRGSSRARDENVDLHCLGGHTRVLSTRYNSNTSFFLPVSCRYISFFLSFLSVCAILSMFRTGVFLSFFLIGLFLSYRSISFFLSYRCISFFLSFFLTGLFLSFFLSYRYISFFQSSLPYISFFLSFLP